MSLYAEKFLPQHHLDNYYIEELLELNEDEIKPILLELLTWLKDMSKPIANQLIPVLIKNEQGLRPIITDLLNNEKTDTFWKYNIIRYVILNLSSATKKEYLNTLKRIVTNPTKYELKYDVVEIALKTLNEIENN